MFNCNGKNSSFILILTSPSGYFGIFKNFSLLKCVVELTTWFRSSFVAQKKKNLELEEMCLTVPLIQNVPYSCPYSIGLLIRTFSVLIKFRSFHKIWVMLKPFFFCSLGVESTESILWSIDVLRPVILTRNWDIFKENPKWYKYLMPNYVIYESY